MAKSNFYRFLQVVAFLGATVLLLGMSGIFFGVADEATRIPAALRADLPFVMTGLLLVGWFAVFLPFRHRKVVVGVAFAILVLMLTALSLLK